MAFSLSTGWSASRLAPRTGLPGTPIGVPQGAVIPKPNPFSQALGIVPPIAGPLPAPGYVPSPIPVPGVPPRSAAGFGGNNSGNISFGNSVTRAAPTPLQAALAKAIGIPTAAAPVVTSNNGLSGGTLPTGIAPGETSSISGPGSPQIFAQSAPAINTAIPGVTNFNTLANNNQNMPPWLMNAVNNLNSPDNFNPTAPAVPVGGGFDPRIGATMAATEARIAAQQKALAEENKARIARVKADAAAAEHAHEIQIQRQRIGGGGINYQSGWGQTY